MTNGQYDLGIIQGSTFNVTLTLTNDVDGSYINLSGYNVTGQMRSYYRSNNVLLGLSPTIYSAISGMININISGSQTASLPVGMFPFDIEIYNSDESSVLKPIRGYAQISPEVTR